jgi:tRNA A-37 threonylcarbamoyl transferase component Bud32
LRSEQITAGVVDKLLATLDQVHLAGVFWGDCRPDNLGIVGNEPLLIDWNLAIERDEHTHPHNGTRCFVSQNLLRSAEERITRTCDDDKESLLKSLIGLKDPNFCKEINEINDATARANYWERYYPILLQPIDQAFEIFKMNLRAN